MCCSVDMHSSAKSGQLLEQDLRTVLVSRRSGCEQCGQVQFKARRSVVSAQGTSL